MTFQDRLSETLKRTLPKVGPEVRAQLTALIQPQALAVMAVVLTAWVGSHAIGLGEIIDAIVAAVGVISIGWAVFSGIDHLYEFAKGTYLATTPAQFDAAADHLAKAIGILGIQAVLAVLFRGANAPRTGAGGRIPVGVPPVNPGLRYLPNIVEDATMAPGSGVTSLWGDIRVSSLGTATDRALVLLHERVHQFLTPKLFLLRNYRVSNMVASYVRSSLWRYIEEALAETIAQVGVNGFSKFFTGVRFPISNGYMFLRRGGGYNPAFAGSGALPEGAALLYSGIVSGITFQLWFSADAPPARGK